MAKLSIVIVNYNVKHYISQCLDSVFNSSLKDVEVIVVDNHSRDGSVEYIKSKYPEVKVIASNHNLGFACGNNLALRSIKSQYALLLNPDTILTTDVLQRSVDFMEANPKCGGLGVCMLNVDGTKAMESRRGLPTPLTSFYKMIGLCKRFPKHKSFGRYYLGCLPWDKPASIEVISGAYCMLRKEALDKVGLLDEDFFMYGEDIDLSYRLLKGGYDNWYIPATMLHYKGESTQKSSFRYVHVFYEAMLIFFRKHYGHLSLIFSLPIKFAIYLKAALTLVGMQLDNARKMLGFVDTRYHDTSRYFFLGSESSLKACRNLAETKGLQAEYLEATANTVPNGHLDVPELKLVKGVDNFIVYDLASYTYDDVLRIFASSPKTNVQMSFYHPEDNLIITTQEVLK